MVPYYTVKLVSVSYFEQDQEGCDRSSAQKNNPFQDERSSMKEKLVPVQNQKFRFYNRTSSH